MITIMLTPPPYQRHYAIMPCHACCFARRYLRYVIYHIITLYRFRHCFAVIERLINHADASASSKIALPYAKDIPYAYSRCSYVLRHYAAMR